jgi:hypothetical protein
MWSTFCFQTGKFVSEGVEEQTEQVSTFMFLNMFIVYSYQNVVSMFGLKYSMPNLNIYTLVLKLPMIYFWMTCNLYLID